MIFIAVFLVCWLWGCVLGSCPYSEIDCPEGQEELFWHALFLICSWKYFWKVCLNVEIYINNAAAKLPRTELSSSACSLLEMNVCSVWDLLVMQRLEGNLGGYEPMGAIGNLWHNCLALCQLMTKNSFEVCSGFCNLNTSLREVLQTAVYIWRNISKAP